MGQRYFREKDFTDAGNLFPFENFSTFCLTRFDSNSIFLLNSLFRVFSDTVSVGRDWPRLVIRPDPGVLVGGESAPPGVPSNSRLPLTARPSGRSDFNCLSARNAGKQPRKSWPASRRRREKPHIRLDRTATH